MKFVVLAILNGLVAGTVTIILQPRPWGGLIIGLGAVASYLLGYFLGSWRKEQ